MKLRSKVLAVGVILSTSVMAGINVNNKFNTLTNQVNNLNQNVEKKEHLIEELENDNKTLQKELTEVSNDVQK